MMAKNESMNLAANVTTSSKVGGKPGQSVGGRLMVLIATAWLAGLGGAFATDSVAAWSVGIAYACYDTGLIALVAWRTRRLACKPIPLKSAASVDSQNRASLGIVVPARNEAAAIVSTVEGLLAQTDLPEQIIVVDDGSVDSSMSLLVDRYVMRPNGGSSWRSLTHDRLLLLTKDNSGKADSMNVASHFLFTDLVVTVDADTSLDIDALAAMRSAFSSEERLVAACGVIEPRSASGIVSRMFGGFQRFEYLRAYLARAAWMQSNALLLVSGAFACYRANALAAVGGFDRNSLVEDYEVIHRLHRHALETGLPWRIGVISGARAITEVPGSVAAFLKQRRRWFAGFLRTHYQYRTMIGNGNYGKLGTFMLPVKTVDTLQPLFGLSAAILLPTFLISGGRASRIALVVIGMKLCIDYVYQLWAVHLYHRWLGLPVRPWQRVTATLCTLAEPFSFQLLRHVGALAGWLTVLRTRASWMPHRHVASKLAKSARSGAVTASSLRSGSEQ